MIRTRTLCLWLRRLLIRSQRRRGGSRRGAKTARQGQTLNWPPIAALFLHLLLPEDRVLDEEKEGYPRAFSDGEIAYES